jgi:hypothetical protein
MPMPFPQPPSRPFAMPESDGAYLSLAVVLRCSLSFLGIADHCNNNLTPLPRPPNAANTQSSPAPAPSSPSSPRRTRTS